MKIRNVVEHPRRDDAVELSVTERQLLNVSEPRVHPTLPRQLDHPRREVDRDHVCPCLPCDPLRQLAPAAADLEHAPRAYLGDHARVRRRPPA